MTTALGLAAVTACLRNLLSDGLVEHNLSGLLGSTASVSVSPPDRVVPQNGAEASQLNLFLHRVSANQGWRNEGLPNRDASGRNRLSNSPLALDLHYLLSAYSSGDLHAEILLGFAMQWLHESPVLTREGIRRALTPSPLPGTSLERALFDSGLADQIELVKITPEYLDTEEMSKLWTATQSHLRPTAAYRATVVLIESSAPVQSPLPVLSRGPVDPVSHRERGVLVEPSLQAALPTLEALSPAGGHLVAQMGETIDLAGHHLDGSARTAQVGNDRFDFELDVPAVATGGPTLVQFSLATAQANDFPVGVYRVGVSLVRPGETDPRNSNRLAMTLAPKITALPAPVLRDGAGTATFSIDFLPALRAGQSVVLVLGQQEYAPEPFLAPTTTLDFAIANAPVSAPPAPGLPPGHLVRLRIDGIDSPIIDRLAKPPVFLGQRVVIT